MKKDFIKTLFFWLPFAAMATVCLLGYGLVQQDIRVSANDQQIQIAEDFTQYLQEGAIPSNLIPTGSPQIDISASLDPYVIIFNASGTVLASSATLHGQNPIVPNGVFASVREHGEDRFTWQPETGVRSAVVVAGFNSNGNSGFVLAGRSLREVEKQEDNLLLIAGLAWIACLVFFFAFIFVLIKIYKKIAVRNP